MSNVLITGGAGFIGSNFVKWYTEQNPGDKSIVLDKLTYAGNISNLSEELENGRIIFIRGSITDHEFVKSVFDRYSPDKVINFAAESHVDRSIDGPRVFVKTNVIGTQNLLDAARSSWELEERTYKESTRFVQISTDEVYGELTEDGYFTEQTPLSPRSPYSSSKASADMIVSAYWHTYHFPAVITRCSNNYGPYQFPEKLIPLMLKNMMSGKKLPVYGEGKNVRDWIYVGDHCEAVSAVIDKGRSGEVYNIGGSTEKRNIEIVKLLIERTRCYIEDNPEYKSSLKTGIENIDDGLITFVKDRLGHDYRYAIDSSKIREELGWKPKVDFDTGIDKTIEWYLSNPGWISDIDSKKYAKLNDEYKLGVIK